MILTTLPRWSWKERRGRKERKGSRVGYHHGGLPSWWVTIMVSFCSLYTHSAKSSQGEASCSETPRHSARRRLGSNRQPSGYQPTRSTSGATAAPTSWGKDPLSECLTGEPRWKHTGGGWASIHLTICSRGPGYSVNTLREHQEELLIASHMIRAVALPTLPGE